MMMDNLTMQVEADQRLLEFETYEQYLESMVTCKDIGYLRSILDCRMISELGYRSSGDTLTREQFYKRLNTCLEYFCPTSLPIETISKNVQVEGNLLTALAKREGENRRGKLATIIFVRIKTKVGFEVSAYIDYTERLFKEDWLPIFQGRKRILPSADDLSYYHWKYHTLRRNNSLNFKVIIDPKLGLTFQCRQDRKMIVVNPNILQPWHTARTVINEQNYDRYEQIVLYDHRVRKRC